MHGVMSTYSVISKLRNHNKETCITSEVGKGQWKENEIE